jgi:hypothetical protein
MEELDTLRAEARRQLDASRDGADLVERRARLGPDAGELRARVVERHRLFAAAMAEAAEAGLARPAGTPATDDVSVDVRAGVPAEVAHVVSRVLSIGRTRRAMSKAQSELQELARRLEIHSKGGGTVRIRFSNGTTVLARFSPFERVRNLINFVGRLVQGLEHVASVRSVRGLLLYRSAAGDTDAEEELSTGKQAEDEDRDDAESPAAAVMAAVAEQDERQESPSKSLVEVSLVPSGTVDVVLCSAPLDDSWIDAALLTE